MTLLAEILAAALLVIGGFFGVVGAWGLVRLPDPMTRLHGPTKAATLGVGSVLIGSMIHSAAIRGAVSWHELLIALFLFMTAPITGYFIAKAHLHLSWDKDELPRPGPDEEWATYGDSAEESPMVAVSEPPRRAE